MHNNSTEFLSLREISRRLGIPPSSVVYYKDRFGQFIPSHEPAGVRSRRATYPSEALEIFKEIRDMYTRHYSAERIERDLAARAHRERPARATRQDAPFEDPAARSMAAVLEKLSAALETGVALRRDVERLQRELASLRAAGQQMESRLDGRLNDGLREERRRREQAMERLEDLLGRQAAGQRQASVPPSRHLDLPLVIRDARGDYLGVAGRNKPFTLRDFLRLVETRARARGGVQTQWSRHRARWRLTLSGLDVDTGQRRKHQLDVQRLTTPSGNEVLELARLAMDGVEAPTPFLLVLFRKIREEFDG